MLGRESDQRLLAGGDRRPELFGAFYRRHEALLLAFFGRRVRDAELVVDLTAETFARAYESRRRYDSARGPAAGWLIGIARHVLAASLQRGRVEDVARRRLAMEPLHVSERSLQDVERHVLESSELVVEQWLSSLPPQQREVIRRHVLEEESYETIAAHLQCSQAVVRKRASRGLSRLRTTVLEER